MNQLLSKLFTLHLFGMLLALVPFISSCGSSDRSPDTEVKPPAIEVADNETNELSQQQIENIAVKSLNTATIDDNFDFQNQHSIRLNLYFSHLQLGTKVSIYSAFDTQTNTPINLLEQGVINQSNRYKSSLSVSNEVQSIFIIRNDDDSNFVEIIIAQDTNISYHFEDY